MKEITPNQKKQKNSSFLLQGSILAIASMVCRVIGLLYRLPLTRIIGDSGNAFYGGAFEVYNIALLLSSYSLPLAVSKLVATRLSKKERKNAYKVFQSALIFAAAAGAIIGGLIFLLAGPIARRIMQSPLSSYALRVLAPGIFIVALLGVMRGYFQGHGNMVPTAVSQVLEQIVNAVVSVLAASYLFRVGTLVGETKTEYASLYGSAYGAAGGTMGTVAGALTALVFLALLFLAFQKRNRRKIAADVHSAEEDYKTIYRVLFATIVPVILSSVIYNLCNFLDQILFNHIMNWQGVDYENYSRLLGMYTGKFLQLVNVPLAIANALASSSIPSLSQSVAIRDEEAIHEKIAMAVRFAMLIAIPSFAGYIVLASPILQLLFRDDRSSMALILASGAIMVVFYSLSTVTNAILQGLNHMMVPIRNALISLAIHIAALVVMLVVFRMNIYSVVFANCLFSLLMCILNQRAIRKIIGYQQEVRRTFILPLLSAAIMGVVTAIVYRLVSHFTGNAIATLLALIVAVLIYGFALVKTGGITEEELAEMPKGGLIIRLFKKAHIL